MTFASLKEGVVDYVIFAGEDEQYPAWFKREVLDGILVDENRYTRYIPRPERNMDYYDKTIVDNDTVFLRKPNSSDVHCTSYETFEGLYVSLESNPRTNSGVAAFREDSIEIVECFGGLPSAYPSWFYDYFSDGIVINDYDETILFYGDDREISIIGHCYFLKNQRGQIAFMDHETFDKYYIKEGIRRL